MMRKQTQTKLFDFSDVGLDFCAGSKNLFPDRFKKMLALGYNEKTANSASISGNTITLTYGVTHGYVADRVLQVTAAGGFNKEVYIDSVTENTVTCTVLDGSTTGLTGVINTKIASLGWQLVYEQANIHIYKFKHIDDTDMYARMCFQNATTSGNRNCVAVGIGRSVDLDLGHIADQNCLTDLATCATVASATSNLRWDFTYSTARTFDNYTYNQGYSIFGRGLVIGSPYHLAFNYRQSNLNSYAVYSGIIPFKSEYDILNYPILIAQNNGISTTPTSSGQLVSSLGYVGSTRISLHNSSANLLEYNFSENSFLPNEIEGFNTTSCTPLSVFTHSQRQFIGYCQGGAYQACYSIVGMPSIEIGTSPSITKDIDYANNIVLHYMRTPSGNVQAAWMVFPVEEVKSNA